MDDVPFAGWWAAFLAEHRHDKDGGYGAADDLVRWTRRRPDAIQAAFRRELVGVAAGRADGWGVALEALGRLASSDDRRALWASSAADLDDGEEAWAAAVLRVLAGEPDGPGYAVVRRFLLDRPIGSSWTGVAWACWPGDSALFAGAWTRYLCTAREADWKGTAVAQAFLRRADALAVLKGALVSVAPAAWAALRIELSSQRDAPWLDRAQRAALEAVLD
jgi:hypothetical protein